MDCKPYEVACRLDKVVQAIGEPTIADWIAITVSALAALGTLWIAWLNLRLIRKQDDRETARNELEARSRRRPLRQQLISNLRGAMNACASGTGLDATLTRLHDGDVNRLIEEAESKNAETLPTAFAFMIAEENIEPTPTGWQGLSFQIREMLDRWVDEPEEYGWIQSAHDHAIATLNRHAALADAESSEG